MKSWREQGVGTLLGLQGVAPGDVAWLLLMSLTLFVLLLPISSYIAAIPFVQAEWGLNNIEAGAVFSASLAGYAVSALFVVPLTDRFGPRRILIGSAGLSVVAHLLFALVAEDPATAVVLRVVAGVGYLGMYVPGLRIVAERFSHGGRGTAMGLFVTAQYAANSASLAITGALMAALDWRDAYLVMSLVAAAGMPMAYVLLRSAGHRPSLGATGMLNMAVLRNPPVRYLMLGYSVHAVVLFSVRVWVPVFLIGVLAAQGVGRPEALAAVVAGAALTVGSVGPVIGGMVSDRWGRGTTASAILALSAVCSLTIGWTEGLPWAVIVAIVVVYGWASAADSAIYQTGITEVADPSHLGSTLALQAFVGLASGLIGPIAFGGLLDVSSEAVRWGVAFSSLSLLSALAIVGFQRMRSLPGSRQLAGGRG